MRTPREIEQALADIVFSRNRRAALLEKPMRELETVRCSELEAFSRLCRQQLLWGSEASRGLAGCYVRTLEALTAAGEDLLGLADDFCESPFFDDVRSLPFAGLGFTAEEAFHAYLSARDLPPTIACRLDHEFFLTIVKLLAVNARPFFEVRDRRIARRDGLWWAVRAYPSVLALPTIGSLPKSMALEDGQVSYLYAARAGAVVHGYIEPVVGELVALGSVGAILGALDHFPAAQQSRIIATAHRLTALRLLEDDQHRAI